MLLLVARHKSRLCIFNMDKKEPIKDDKLQNNPKRWLMEISSAKKRRKPFLLEAKHIDERYRGEIELIKNWEGTGNPYSANSFNILYSNTKILEPAVFARLPKPICKPKFPSRKAKDNSPQAAAAQVLQRALEQIIDQYDFKSEVRAAVKDALTAGEGQLSVAYDAAVDGDEVSYETAVCYYEHYDDILYGYAKLWRDVPWVAFRKLMSRKQLEQKFGAKGKKCPLNYKADCNDRVHNQEHILDRAEVWKIHDKESGKEIFLCDAMEDEFLLIQDSPVKFKNKLPVPKPLQFITSTTSLNAIPLFRMYSTQAKQLEKVSRRIIDLTDALRVRGCYDAELSEIMQVLSAGNNEMIPIENAAKYHEQGFDKGIWMLDLMPIAAGIVELKKQERSIIEVIYEITGISDIMRGSTSDIETARAQEIKSNFGTLPLQEMQQRVQEFIADVIRLKAEIIGENFSIETLQKLTGLEYPTNDYKQQIQRFMAMSGGDLSVLAQVGINPEEAQEMMQKPTWEEIKTILESDLLRTISIDIETDSTLAAELVDDKRDITELLVGVMDFIERAAPAVQAGIMPMEAAKALLMAGVRRYKLGSEVEDTLATIGEQQEQQAQQPPPPDPEIEKLKIKAELDKQSHQMQLEKMQMQMQIDQQMHQAKMSEIQAGAMAEVEKQRAQMQDKMITGMN
jgi:hypothetical protein